MKITRRTLMAGSLGVGALAPFGLAHAGTPLELGPPSAARTTRLGANFNTAIGPVDAVRGPLVATGAHWVRAMVPIHKDTKGVPEQVKRLVALSAEGHRFEKILGLKFILADPHAPRPSDADVIRRWEERTRPIVKSAAGKVRIITVGNEPFVDSVDKHGMMPFYDHMARKVLEWVGAAPTDVYMGALNRVGMDHPRWTEQDVDSYLAIVRRHKGIKGVDVHPHVEHAPQLPGFVTRATKGIRADQDVICTEFSLIHKWAAHLGAKLQGPDFDHSRTVLQFLDAALAEHGEVTQARWNAFCRQQPWYWENRNFLDWAIRQFSESGRVRVATYGFQQSWVGGRLGDKSLPWILNSVYCESTTKPRPDGSMPHGMFFDDFKRLASRA